MNNPHRRRGVKRRSESDESDDGGGSSPGGGDGTGTPLPASAFAPSLASPLSRGHAAAHGQQHALQQIPFHRSFTGHRPPDEGQLQARAGTYVGFGQTEAALPAHGPRGEEPVGHGPGRGEHELELPVDAETSARRASDLARAGAGQRHQQRLAAEFQGALQGLGPPPAGTPQGDWPPRQAELAHGAGALAGAPPHQAIHAGFPPHYFPHHANAGTTTDAAVAHSTSSQATAESSAPALAHQPLHHLVPQGQGQGDVNHNHNHLLVTPPADVVAPPYPPHQSHHLPHQNHHHLHHLRHQNHQHSSTTDPPSNDPPGPTSHDAAALLCHPHDPRLLQPHHAQPQHHPHHHQPQPQHEQQLQQQQQEQQQHQRHQIDAQANSYFPPDAAEHLQHSFQPDQHGQLIPAPQPRYFFPTPLDHPAHAPPLPLVPFHDVDHIQQFYQHHFPNWPLIQRPDGSWSPLMHPELSILNAESYNDGTPSFRAPRSLPALRGNAGPSRSGSQALKRPQDHLADVSGEAEEPPQKRGRGRPKLTNSEESPADRRRTQIRLAQRAYRERKENNITILQKKVKELDGIAADMSSAFTQLHDFAIARGLLDSDPEFGRKLQATTQTFLELARRSHDIAVSKPGDTEQQAPAEQQAEGENNSASPGSASETKQTGRSGSPGAAGSSSSGTGAGQKVLFAGLIVSHEPDTDYADAPAPAPPPVSGPGSWSLGDPSSSTSSSHPASAVPYEVVSQPTMHNASFPFGMSYETTPETTMTMPVTTTTTNPLLPLQLDMDTTSFLDPSRTAPDMFPPSFFSQFSPAGQDPFLPPPLPPPSTFSHQERTFGRRLHRAALEQGLRLLHMPDPPPHFYAAVFGFCLLFESRDNIVRRMTDCLSINQQETLCNWKFPFLHLGGAGTFFEELNEMDDPVTALNFQDVVVGEGNLGFGIGSETQQAEANQPEVQQRSATAVGNRGLLEPHRSKIARDSLFGQGPWTPAIESTRDLRVDRKLRIVVPGWEGDFYDCDEIEWYLQQRGVIIPPAADIITAEIDEEDFLGGQKPGPTKAFDATIDNFITDWLMKDFVKDGTGAAVAAQLATPSATTETHSGGTPMGEPDLARAESMFAAQSKDPVWQQKRKGPAVPEVNVFGSASTAPVVAAPGKRLVTINVDVLVEDQFV